VYYHTKLGRTKTADIVDCDRDYDRDRNHYDLGYMNEVEGKKLTNMRTSSSDGIVKVQPKVQYTLEKYMYIAEDECIELTTENIRLRKTHIDRNARKRAEKAGA